MIIHDSNFESLYWLKHFNFILAVINVYQVLVPSQFSLVLIYRPRKDRQLG